ncbi:hypothetical protein MKX07_005216 [Trichoderma sp. CBMAI-0711]|nr:hypothetical protein MKX07_005216 [Trichoderma sp. CBMAI-0711]
MADVRALLRQQRAARRITHPYAAYSDTGKLLCTLCRDQIRAESHWDAHLASDKHRKRLSTISAPPPPDVNGGGGDDDDDYCVTDEVNEQAGMEDLNDVVGRHQRADTPSSTHKRKLDHAAAASIDERETDNDVDEEDEVRRKRSRHASPETGRRKPQGPSQGVQVQMPSRSTTPADSQHSGSSAAAAAAAKSTTKLATSLPSRQASNLATPASSSSMSIQQEAPPQPQPPQQQPQQPQQPQPPAASTSQNQQQIDEDEWAAFEADIAAETAPYDADAVISRPAMTAEEAAAAKEAAAAAAEQEALENPEFRKTKADADIEDEREEATRALEEEFEEMQELEARVQRLKEKREALMRKRGETVTQEQAGDDGVASLQAATSTKPSSDAQDEGKENAITKPAMNGAEAEHSDEDDEDDDEEEEDDWDGFRFRTGR